MKRILLSLIFGYMAIGQTPTTPPPSTPSLVCYAWVDSPSMQAFAGIPGTLLPVFSPYLFVVAAVINQPTGAAYTISVAGTTKNNTPYGNTLPANSNGTWTVFMFPLQVGDTIGAAPTVTYSTMSGTVTASVLKN